MSLSLVLLRLPGLPGILDPSVHQAFQAKPLFSNDSCDKLEGLHASSRWRRPPACPFSPIIARPNALHMRSRRQHIPSYLRNRVRKNCRRFGRDLSRTRHSTPSELRRTGTESSKQRQPVYQLASRVQHAIRSHGFAPPFS